MPAKKKQKPKREIVMILGREIEVNRMENSPGCSDTAMGRSYMAASAVWISPHINPSEQAPTLTHECLHMVSALLNLGLDEKQVCGLEVALTGMGFCPTVTYK